MHGCHLKRKKGFIPVPNNHTGAGEKPVVISSSCQEPGVCCVFVVSTQSGSCSESHKREWWHTLWSFVVVVHGFALSCTHDKRQKSTCEEGLEKFKSWFLSYMSTAHMTGYCMEFS